MISVYVYVYTTNTSPMLILQHINIKICGIRKSFFGIITEQITSGF